MPNNPYNYDNVLFDQISGFEIFLNFFVLISSRLPLRQRGHVLVSRYSAGFIYPQGKSLKLDDI